MTLMPISSYPMLSDDCSQQQVLREHKAELNDQSQAVEQSGMNERDKQSALHRIGVEYANTRQEISKKRDLEEIKKHANAEDTLRRQTEKSEEEKRVLDRSV